MFQTTTPCVLVLTPTADEYRMLSSVLDANAGTFRLNTETESRLVSVSTIGQGHNAAFASTQAALASLTPSIVLLSGIAGARYDADFGPFDCVAATSCIDYSLSERLPKGHARPTAIPLGPSTPMAKEFSDFLPWWEPVLITTIQNELTNLEAVVPSISSVRDKDITAKNQSLRRSIKQALEKHAKRDSRQFVSANVCSGNDLHKDADYLQELIGHDKRLWLIEMEFANVIRACKDADVPCLMVRSISDVVGYRKQPIWTEHAALVAALAVKALLWHDGFWSWLNKVNRLRTRHAMILTGGNAAGTAEEALSRIEDLAPQDVRTLGQRPQAHVADPPALREAAEVVAKGLNDGYLPFEQVAQRLEPITEVCSGCAFGARRAQLLRPAMESIALHSPLRGQHQLTILVNAVRLAIVEGDYAKAQQLLSRSNNDFVRNFIKALPPEGLKRFLQAGLELYGIDSDDGKLFWALLLDEGLPAGSMEAATAARCLACKAVAGDHALAEDLVDLARRYTAQLTDEAMRRDLTRAIEVIALYHTLLKKTDGEWSRLRGDLAAKRQLDSVRQLPNGRWPLRHAESALLAALAFVASGDAKEANSARKHLAILEHRGKVTHCLFDLPDLKTLVESFWDHTQ